MTLNSCFLVERKSWINSDHRIVWLETLDND